MEPRPHPRVAERWANTAPSYPAPSYPAPTHPAPSYQAAPTCSPPAPRAPFSARFLRSLLAVLAATAFLCAAVALLSYTRAILEMDPLLLAVVMIGGLSALVWLHSWVLARQGAEVSWGALMQVWYFPPPVEAIVALFAATRPVLLLALLPLVLWRALLGASLER